MFKSRWWSFMENFQVPSLFYLFWCKKTLINCVLRKELAKKENFMEKSCCLDGNSPLYWKRTTALRFQFHTSVCVAFPMLYWSYWLHQFLLPSNPKYLLLLGITNIVAISLLVQSYPEKFFFCILAMGKWLT